MPSARQTVQTIERPDGEPMRAWPEVWLNFNDLAIENDRRVTARGGRFGGDFHGLARCQQRIVKPTQTRIMQDERRHIAYGTYLIRRIVAEHPESWAFVERRWAEITGPITMMADLFKERVAKGEVPPGGRGGYGTIDIEFVVRQSQRRLEMLRVSTDVTADDVEHATIESFEPTEMAELTA